MIIISKEFLELENKIMKSVLSENIDIKDKLLEQYNSAVVVNRDFTGRGFFINYHVKGRSPMSTIKTIA